MKKIVKLGEAELRRMIAESIRNMVTESDYDNVKKIYYPLIDNITEFIDCLCGTMCRINFHNPYESRI